jgi:DNA repair protein RecN (Recombination protein N)
MLRRLALRDYVIVDALELELGPGCTVLTGETGAGKSILVDALQLALGARADAVVVREGAARAEVAAEFDTPAALRGWLAEAGFDAEPTLLLRRVVDVQGRSRAWINGSTATVAQLREAADWLVEIHGQHAWQSLTRPAAVRALLDAQAGVAAAELAARHADWKAAADALARARSDAGSAERERERLAWQVGELERLAPGADEWAALDAEHQRLTHAQALLDAAAAAQAAIDGGDGDEAPGAQALVQRAIAALHDVVAYDARLAPAVEVLQGAQAQLDDAAHTLAGYLARAELDPARLAEVDARLSAWMALARRHRRPPAELPALLAQGRRELAALDAAADLDALEAALAGAERAWRAEAQRASAARHAAAPRLAAAVTQAMQTLGMAGGRLEVALLAQDAPQSWGLESVELRVAGHAGSTPRPLAKVASGGELSRLALAIAVTTAAGRGDDAPATLIFDEIDAGIGGAVADTVGRLLRQLGAQQQVLAVTHLAQVAACADAHLVVRKAVRDGQALSELQAVVGEARVAEIARMLGGAPAGGTGLQHAQAMLQQAQAAAAMASAAALAPSTPPPSTAPDQADPAASRRAARTRA